MDAQPCAIEPVKVGRRPGVSALCRRCGYSCAATGRGSRSVRAALAELRRDCPIDQSNFYIAESGEDETGLVVTRRSRSP